MSTPSHDLYLAAQLLLGDLNIVPTQDKMNLFVAWEIEEHGWDAVLTGHNPMNTTLSMPGAVTINSAGVKSYGTWDEGIRANIITLEHGYATLLKSVIEGNIDLFVSAKSEWLLWSGGNQQYGYLIRDIYHLLGAVPSQYLTQIYTTPTGAVPVTYKRPPVVTPSYPALQRSQHGRDLIYYAQQMSNKLGALKNSIHG